jgi:transcriptional regulator with XRE-family HTH domain
MARSRGEGPAEGDAILLPASVPDIGLSLRLARERAGLTLPEAAVRAGLASTQLEVLESDGAARQQDRIATLRALRAYANSLGLPGDDYVLVAVEQWPSFETTSNSSGDTAVVPVISISSAPAGGHSSAGGWGSGRPGDATGVPDAATGVIGSILPLPTHDTGRLSLVDTGEIPAVVESSPPRLLKVVVGVAALLVALGAAALVEHTHLRGWAHAVNTSTDRWYHSAESGLGITSTPASHTGSGNQHHAAADTPKVTATANPSTKSVAIDVAASPFTVRIVASGGPCWVSAYVPGHPPLFSQVLAAGQAQNFTVTSALTVETGSSSGHAYVYKGFKLLTYYFPTAVPFQMDFNAVG